MTASAPATDRPDAQNIGLGIAYRVGAMACMALMFAGVKWTAGEGIPVLEIVFFRNAFAFIPLTLDTFWGPLAYVLIGGVAVGTAITLLFVPALYALWFRLGRG